MNRKFCETLKIVNTALPKFITGNATLSEINALNYAPATVIQNTLIPPVKFKNINQNSLADENNNIAILLET